MDEKRYTVSEAVRLIGVESHVLRYWEEELNVRVERTNLGHRSYSQENVELFLQVKVLRERGLQMKAIRAWMKETKAGAAGDFSGRMDSEKKAAVWEDQNEIKEEPLLYEVISGEEPAGDSLEMFAALLKQIMEEVAQEQDVRLERMMEDSIRDGLEELYLQYFQALAEAAADREKGAHRHSMRKEAQEGWLKRLLRRLLP